MEKLWFLIVSASFFIFLHLVLKHFTRYKNIPPSPPSLPIVGHLHLMKVPIHRELQRLSDKYGPILNLSFGNKSVLIVSSTSAVEECFSKNDIVFANRPRLLAGKYLTYGYSTIAASPYGHRWRNLRRLAVLEILSTTRLNMFLSIRQDEVKFLLKNLCQTSGRSFTKVEMKSKLSELSFNIIMRMVAGKRYFGVGVDEPEEAKRFRGIISEIFEIAAAAKPEDFLPFLRWVYFQSYEKRIKIVHRKSDRFFQSLVNEHRNKRNCSAEGGRTNTIIDSMLSLQESEPENYSDETIKDTSSVTTEWAMSLLLNHPVMLKKARAELDSHVGHDRLVDEPDLVKLQYLQSIINETLRLFPAFPLLVPHESSDYCTIGGYDVPPSTILFVNAWAIHRDPKVWEDPTSFRPERFQGLEVVGDTYKFIPFGEGRRSCPGAGLAKRAMGLALAALIQCFDWERTSEEAVDLTEGTGFTMSKAKPLEAMCKARDSMFNVLSELK